MARVLITGGAGFIGSHLVARCIEQGDTVHVIARPETCLQRLQPLSGAYTLHILRLCDGPALRICFAQARPDQVFHLAARTRREMEPALADAVDSINEDLLDLIGLLATAAETQSPPRVLIRTGSLAEYGPSPAPYLESQREMPLTPYSAALVAGAHYAQMLQPRLSFPVITARLALIYGPGQSEDFLVPGLIRRCLAHEPSKIRRPRHRRDLLHVEDAVDALCRLGSTPLLGGGIVNIATGVAPTMYETAQLILNATRADPSLIEYDWAEVEDGIPDFRASPAKAHDLLGWSARIALPEGIDRTVAWFRDNRFSAEVSHASDQTHESLHSGSGL